MVAVCPTQFDAYSDMLETVDWPHEGLKAEFVKHLHVLVAFQV